MKLFRFRTAFLIGALIALSGNLAFSQITVTSQYWTAGWGPAGIGGPEPAGLDTAKLPLVPERFGSVAIGDLDGDGDMDFVSGSNRGRFFYFQNQGTVSNPVFIRTSGAIPSLDTIKIGVVQNTNEVRPHLVDIDSDGDLDLMVGSRWNQAGLLKLDDIHFYRNTGTATSPFFAKDTIPGLQGQQIGEFSSFGFGDLDNDGDLDFTAGGSDSCTYFENVGTPTSPSFVREFGSSSLFPPTLWVETSFLAPTPDMEDFDGDGDLDMYFMNEAGFIRYIPNNGTATSPDFAPYISYPAHSFDTVDFGAFGAMCFEDITGDGIKDVIATHWNPTRWYWYKGVSNGPNPTVTIDSAISCNGLTDAGVTITSTTGGTPPYTYLWSTGSTDTTLTGLAPGTYTVTVTDSLSATATKSIVITEPASLIAATVIDSNVTCNGFSNGGATASAVGGTTPYNFAWSNSATTVSITGVLAGTYSVTITDANGCTATNSNTITEPAVLIASTTVDSNSTGGLANGGTTASVTGGTTPYNYAWSNAATTASITGLAMGTYTVTVTDNNSCTATSSATISSMSANTVVDSNVTCNGFSDGGATASPSGGTAPYNYAWSNGATTASITGVTANTYMVTITDNNGITATSSVNITEPSGLLVQAIVDSNVTCNGFSNGGASAGALLGTFPHTYTWSNGATTPSITGVTANTYTVTATDNNGCTATNSVTITEPAGLILQAIVDSNVTCNGFSDGGASAGALLGTFPHTYAWSNGATTPSITGVTANTYSVTTTDNNGCTATNSVTITEPAGLILQAIVDSNVTCNGFSDGGASAGALLGTFPHTYTWSNGATTPSITGVTANTYSVTTTDNNGCTATNSVTITEPTALMAATVVDSNTSCNGFSDGGASASASGGTTTYNYLWSNAATNASITGVIAGTYTITVTDANGCTSTSSATITEPAVLVATSIVDSNATCNGFANGGATASATGGTAPYSYEWNNTATTASITGISAGTYTVTITDANGCTSTSSATVTEPLDLAFNLTINSPISCNGANDAIVSYVITGGTAPYYNIFSGTDTMATMDTDTVGPINLPQYVIYDANGCYDTTSVLITEPTALVAATVVDSNVTCNGFANGGITASATGGTGAYTYAWSNAATTVSITGVIANTYTVTVSDANGCTDTSSATITEPTVLMATSIVDSNITCNGLSNGGASASATGGTTPYSYAWSNTATTPSITGVSAGTYTVTVTDANGCTDSTSVIITEPALLVASTVADSNVTCFGGADGGVTASASGGTTTYSYLWNTGAAAASITGLMAGTYTVTVTDANGCTDTSSAMVTEPPLLSVDLGNDTSVCFGGSLTLDPGAGFASYLWQDNSTNQTYNVDTSTPGVADYSVTVTNNNGCIGIDTINVTVFQATGVAISGANDLCAYEIDTLIASSGFVSYIWNTSATTSQIIVDANSLSPGSQNYSVTATDSNGCVSDDAVSFNVHNPVVVDLGPDTSIVWVDGGNNTYTLDAGAGFNSYLWSDLTTNQTLDVTLTNMGTISVVVTDGNGCYGADTVFVDFILDVPTLDKASVNIYPNPAADYLNIDMKGFNGQEVQVIITDMGGKHVINNILKVNGNQTSTLDVSNLPTGTYFIQIQAENQKVVKHIVIR
ncbi:T9SS type A sorting domain-containing protein [bacterium SCSIO 12643]|nr:T9SS type A sorting domain-containing protein [bacterium SCSIO 12643]